MLTILKGLLQQFINDIDSGNSNIPEKEQEELIDLIQKINSKDMSKTESADYIGVSKPTFDNYIRKGLIPKGKKRRGFNELCWFKADLNKYLSKNVKRIRKKL